MTVTLDLFFIKPKVGDTPVAPISQIYVKTHSQDEAGRIFITPDCMSLREMDEQIDRLILELEDIRKQTKRLYNK